MTSTTDIDTEAFHRDGYLVVDDIVSVAELEDLRDECETMVAAVSELVRSRHPRETRLDDRFRQGMVDGYSIEWEWENPDSDTLKMIRYFFRRWPRLTALARHGKFRAPIAAITGDDDLVVHSDKYNLKAPGEGSAYFWHQDLPFFRIEDGATEIERCITGILFLDDADSDNGCIEVAPGSQRLGLQALGSGTYGGMHPRDPSAFDEQAVPVPVRAGSAVYLDPLVMHRSGPNRSATQRRNILYAFQPRPQNAPLYDELGLPGRLRREPFATT